MNLKNWFLKYQKPKQAMKLVNILLILAMLLTSLPMATQAAMPERQTQDNPCIAALDNDGAPEGSANEPGAKLYLPIIIQTAKLFSASSLLGQPQAPVQVVRELNYEVGMTYAYDYVVEIANRSYQRTAEGESQTGESTTIVKMDADITIESKNDDGSFNGRIELNNPSICNIGDTNEDIIDTDEFSTELQKPLRFTQAANGIITSVQIPEGSNIAATNMQKGVINALQVTLQAEDTYTVEEIGNQGTYNVDYTLTESDGNLTIKKAYNQDSFKEMNRQGDEIDSFILDNSFDATLGGNQGILTSVEVNESLETGDGVLEPDGSNTGFAGTTVWTVIEGKTRLTFDSVKKASAIRAAALNLVYQEGDLTSDFEEDSGSSFLEDIDVENLDLDAEVQALVDEPENLELFLRILDILTVSDRIENDSTEDDAPKILDVIAVKLSENAADETVTTVLIDLLVESGTPQAQDVINSILGNERVQAASLSATMSITTEEHALIGLVLIDSPTMTTVNTIQTLGKEDSDLRETAISVLGATIDKLSDNGDEETSSTLTEELMISLGNAASEEDLELYIGALGNASQPDTLDDIAQYFTDTLTLADGTEITETTGIRFAALSAARSFPGKEAEDILVAALADEDELFSFRMTAFDALSVRPDLSVAALATLNANASLGNTGTDGDGSGLDDGGVQAATTDEINLSASKEVNKRFGNKYLGVEFPGTFSAATPPHSPNNSLDLYGQQRVDSLLLKKRINLVDGRVKLWRNSATTYKFGVYLDLLNYRIRKRYEQQFDCVGSRSGNLWKGSVKKGHRFDIPVAGIPAEVDLELAVHARLDYNVYANVCNPSDMYGFAAIVPSGYANVKTEVGVNIFIGRFGAGANVALFNTAFAHEQEVRANINTQSARLCLTIRVDAQPLSGWVYFYADSPFLGRGKKKKVYDFAAPRQSFNLLKSCWP